MKPNQKIIVFRESFFQSVMSDICTFSIIIVSYAANYYLVDGNNFTDGIITIMLAFFFFGRGSMKKHEFYTVKEVVDFLEEK